MKREGGQLRDSSLFVSLSRAFRHGFDGPGSPVRKWLSQETCRYPVQPALCNLLFQASAWIARLTWIKIMWPVSVISTDLVIQKQGNRAGIGLPSSSDGVILWLTGKSNL